MDYILEMLNIRKEFPGIVANDNITLKLKKNEIHALLGENGAGKSTLMSVLFGLYTPEKGDIYIKGEKVNIDNPNIATEKGIGMVHQHFKLVDKFTVTENIILGMEKSSPFYLDARKAKKRIIELSKKYNLNVDPDKKISDISVGMQQRVEILKMLYRGADILIFDEPTAVLTPQEIDQLIEIMRGLIAEGKSIILITHKLKEIKSVADSCTVIRKGRYINTVDVKDHSEQDLANLMVGREINFNIEKSEANPNQENVIKFDNVSYTDKFGIKKLKNVSFEAYAGEILGVAGVEGNGQSEIINLLSGLKKPTSGKIYINGEEISKKTIRQRTKLGLGHIPEDRHKHGLILHFSLGENIVLQEYYKDEFTKNKFFLNEKAILNKSDEIIEKFDVRAGEGPYSKARSMSGGNQQKAIVGREINHSKTALIAAQPTRGLDVGAIENIHNRIIQERDKNKAILLVSLELDEVLELSDKIIVMHAGEISGEVMANQTDERQLGLMMAGGNHD